MASKKIIPRQDLSMLAHAKVGGYVETRKWGEAHVTQLMKSRAVFALKHWNDND
jgi:hypothetical protein